MKIETFLDFETILANRAAPVGFALRLTAPELTLARPQPAAFCVVLDRSGSMGGEPLRKAREATAWAVRHLRPEDQFALVTFDDEARTLIPLQRIADKQAVLDGLHRIHEGGSTNLTGGWMLGRDELRGAPAGTSRRLLLLSDGHLNVGVTDPAIVRQIVATGLEQDGVRTSALGFGDGYNEDLMSELARVTQGQFYDADAPEKLPAIFEAELDGLQKTVIQNVRVRVRPLDFCESIDVLSNAPVVRLPDGRHEYAVGDLISGEERILCWLLEVLPLPVLPGGRPVTTLEGERLLEIEILHDRIGESEITSHVWRQVIRIQSTQDPSEVKQNQTVVSWIAGQQAGRVMNDVVRLLDGGRMEEAVALLDRAAAKIGKYGPAGQVAEALGILAELKRRLEGGEWTDRDRKMARYRTDSYQKMSSTQHWSSDQHAPSFTRPPRRGK